MAITFGQLIGKLRFGHLRLLTVLESAGSLRAAAQQLSLTQPALSKTLKDLEEALGFRLFTRTPTGLRLTSEGEVMTRGAALMMRELEHVQREARSAGEKPVAILRLGAPAFVVLRDGPAIGRALLRQEPPVFLRIQEDTVPRLFEALLQGDLDALITTYSHQMRQPDRLKGFRYKRLYEERFAIIASARHPLAQKRSVDWAALSAEPWILPARDALIRDFVDEAFLRAGITPPTPGIDSSSPLSNIALAASNLGLSVVPASTIAESAHRDEVAWVKVRPPIPPVAVALVYRESAEAHLRVTSVLAALSSGGGRAKR